MPAVAGPLPPVALLNGRGASARNANDEECTCPEPCACTSGLDEALKPAVEALGKQLEKLRTDPVGQLDSRSDGTSSGSPRSEDARTEVYEPSESPTWSDKDEPILKENGDRFTLFPIR